MSGRDTLRVRGERDRDLGEPVVERADARVGDRQRHERGLRVKSVYGPQTHPATRVDEAIGGRREPHLLRLGGRSAEPERANPRPTASDPHEPTLTVDHDRTFNAVGSVPSRRAVRAPAGPKSWPLWRQRWSLVVAPAGGAPTTRCSDEQWAFSPGTVFDLPAALAALPGRRRDRRGRRLRASSSSTPTSRRTSGPTRRGRRTTASTTTATATSTTSTASTSPAADATTTCTTASATAPTSPARSRRRPTAGGVVGVAYRAKLMTVKVLDDRGGGTHRRGRRGHPLRRRQRRADHQPQPREPRPTTRACARP